MRTVWQLGRAFAGRDIDVSLNHAGDHCCGTGQGRIKVAERRCGAEFFTQSA
jgi:hypothetical protein